MPLLFESGRMSSMPKKIDPALRDRAVRLVTEHQQEYSSLTAASEAVARQLGIDAVEADVQVAFRARLPPGSPRPSRPPGGTR